MYIHIQKTSITSDFQRHGLKVYLRDPNAFAPMLGTDQYLLLGSNAAENRRQIGKFSQRDAEVRAQ